MSLKPALPWPLRLTAGFLLVQGALSLAGTALSLFQHRPTVDVSIGSLLLGLGLRRRSRWARGLALASLAVQLLLAGGALYATVAGPGPAGQARLFAYLLADPPPAALPWILAGLVLALGLQAATLLLPGTRRLFDPAPRTDLSARRKP